MSKDSLRPKRKMQDVSFKTVQEFLDYLPPEELVIVEKLRNLVYQAIPDVLEKLTYNVPFFKRHANICFIWPGSVTWGNVCQRGVRLGFTKGYLLSDEMDYLDKGNRKEVYYRDFFLPEEIDENILLTFLSYAVDIDEEIYLQKTNDKG